MEVARWPVVVAWTVGLPAVQAWACVDADFDGYTDVACGGSDCDDSAYCMLCHDHSKAFMVPGPTSSYEGVGTP